MLRKELFLIALTAALVTPLKITRFEVPSLLVPGDSAQLICFYDLGEEKLYSVKWYKDYNEFFRFFPSLKPQYMAFPAPGLNVDMARSGPQKVFLKNLTLDTEGRYTCQVSADEPLFSCVQVHRDIIVYIPPATSPQLSGGLAEHGDNLTLRCSSPRSKPAANLSFYVNDVPVKMVPDFTSSQEIVRHSDQLESSYASISVPLSSEHIPQGPNIRFTCAATISNVVTAVSKELYISRNPHNVLGVIERACSTRNRSWLAALIAFFHVIGHRFLRSYDEV